MRSRILLSTLAWLCIAFPYGELKSDPLKIVHFDVGKGDATLIISPSGTTFLVDAGSETFGGDSAAALIGSYLAEEGIDSLTYSLATHFHDDHINGFTTLYDTYGYQPQAAFDRGSPGIDTLWYNCSSYPAYIDYVESESIREIVEAGDFIDLGGGVILTAVYTNGHFMNGRIDLLRPRHQFENARSICLLLEYANFRYVVGGDLIGSGDEFWDKETPTAGMIGDVDVFQLDHHGGSSSTNENWLDVLRPEAGVVSSDSVMVKQVVLDRIDACETMEVLYHTEYTNHQGAKSCIVGGNVILETDGLGYYTVDGDTFTIAESPPVSVTVTPDPQYVIVPPGGGSFEFDIELINNSADTVIFDYWTAWHRSGRWRLGQAAERDTLAAGETLVVEWEDDLLESRVYGNYIYEARVGIFPGEIWDSHCFSVWKDTTDVGDSGGDPGGAIIQSSGDETAGSRAADGEVILTTSPNPFNPVTTINFDLNNAGIVNLAVYDIRGCLIADLVNGHLDAGEHRIDFDGSGLVSGIYIYILRAGDFASCGKLVLMK
jgi:beta-lactamase superfamily II metal-dependent hydrolase